MTNQERRSIVVRTKLAPIHFDDGAIWAIDSPVRPGHGTVTRLVLLLRVTCMIRSVWYEIVHTHTYIYICVMGHTQGKSTKVSTALTSRIPVTN